MMRVLGIQVVFIDTFVFIVISLDCEIKHTFQGILSHCKYSRQLLIGVILLYTRVLQIVAMQNVDIVKG